MLLGLKSGDVFCCCFLYCCSYVYIRIEFSAACTFPIIRSYTYIWHQSYNWNILIILLADNKLIRDDSFVIHVGYVFDFLCLLNNRYLIYPMKVESVIFRKLHNEFRSRGEFKTQLNWLNIKLDFWFFHKESLTNRRV